MPNPDGLRRYGVLGSAPRLVAWAESHPGRIAVVQAVVFAIAFGLITALTEAHGSLGSDVARAVIAAVIFGLLMWAVNAFRLRRPDRG